MYDASTPTVITTQSPVTGTYNQQISTFSGIPSLKRPQALPPCRFASRAPPIAKSGEADSTQWENNPGPLGAPFAVPVEHKPQGHFNWSYTVGDVIDF